MKIKTALLSALPAAALLVAWAPAASASTVAVQPDGKIVLAGYASLLVPPSCAHRCYSYWLLRPAAVRLDADGHPDPSFGSRGGVVDFRAPPFGAPEFASAGRTRLPFESPPSTEGACRTSGSGAAVLPPELP